MNTIAGGDGAPPSRTRIAPPIGGRCAVNAVSFHPLNYHAMNDQVAIAAEA